MMVFLNEYSVATTSRLPSCVAWDEGHLVPARTECWSRLSLSWSFFPVSAQLSRRPLRPDSNKRVNSEILMTSVHASLGFR